MKSVANGLPLDFNRLNTI